MSFLVCPMRTITLGVAVSVVATLSFAGATVAPAHAHPDPAAASARPAQAANAATGRHKPAAKVTVIAHRGASGYRPEHTIAAYRLAVKQCADAIEPDLVSTKDGVLVDRHENEISGTTDVSERPEFTNRKRTKTIDGVSVTGWFTEDFTLAELRRLRAVERLPELRPGSAAYDGRYKVPTFAEVLDFAAGQRTCKGKRVLVVPEIKHGTYFDSIGLSMEEKVVRELRRRGLDGRRSTVIIQSFEIRNLKELNRKLDVPLVQLVDCAGAPADRVAIGDPTTYADMVTPAGLRKIARYADQLGACKNLMIPRQSDGTLGEPTSVIRDAHRAGLTVTGWTFRAENEFLPIEFRSGDNPAAYGDMAGEIRAFVRAGMDAFFTDQPDLGVAALRR